MWPIRKTTRYTMLPLCFLFSRKTSLLSTFVRNLLTYRYTSYWKDHFKLLKKSLFFFFDFGVIFRFQNEYVIIFGRKETLFWSSDPELVVIDVPVFVVTNALMGLGHLSPRGRQHMPFLDEFEISTCIHFSCYYRWLEKGSRLFFRRIWIPSHLLKEV